ncbi:hypothetical protein Tco_1425443 [Tanacetum coccineum]
MIGSLLYLIASRPDIMFSVCLCARFQENPKTTHLEAVKRIFRYIRGTSHLRLWYPKGTRIETVVYADSDQAGDYVDRKSTSDVCTFMRCCLTSWFTKKQTALAISITESEYVSSRKACQQALWMKQALIDYGIRLDNVPIICDNKGAIDLSFKPFLTLNKPICPRFVVEFYHSLEVKRNELDIPYIEFKLGQFTFTLTPSRLSQILKTPHALETFYTSKHSPTSLDDHPNSNYFGPKHDIVKKAITTPRTTQAQLQRDPNKLYIDDIPPDLKGWELFFKKNSFALLTKETR